MPGTLRLRLVCALFAGVGAAWCPAVGPRDAAAVCLPNPPRGFAREDLTTAPGPTPLVVQRFCLGRRRAELWTTAPSGSPLGGSPVRWELRAGPTPEQAVASSPLPVTVSPVPRPTNDYAPWREMSWTFVPPRDGLFYAATAIDADGVATAPAMAVGGSVRRWGVTTDRRLRLDVRFPVGLAALGLPVAAVGIVVSEGWVGPATSQELVFWQATVPTKTGRRGLLSFRDRRGETAQGVTRLELRGRRKARLRLRARTDRSIPSDVPLRLVLRIGDRELDLGGGYYPHAGE